MKIVDLKYNKVCAVPSDIHRLLPILKSYAEKCKHITELGVRSVISTWAFLAARPEKLISVDLDNPEKHGTDLQSVYTAAKEIDVNFQFIEGDDLKLELEETDLMFIDTYHEYSHLIKELTQLSNKVRKYIILHDTVIFGAIGEDGGPGLLKAITEFLRNNKEWKIAEQFYYNNGLTVLEKNKK